MPLAIPTGARLVTLASQTPLLRGVVARPVLPSWPDKDPAEFLVYGADFGPAAESCARIAAVQAAVGGGLATVGQVGHHGRVALLELGGGTDGDLATVTLAAQLDSGEVLVRTVLLPIRAQPGSMLIPPFGSLPVVPPAGFRLTDPATGRTLTDPATGLPLTLRAPGGAAVAVTDPETGAVLTDPASGLPLTVTLPGATTVGGGATAGASTPGHTFQQLGIAVSATAVQFDPQASYVRA